MEGGVKLYSTWLPMPPTLSKAYGGGSGQQRFKTRANKDWHRQAMLIAKKIKTITEPIFVKYTVFFKDSRSGDLSNRLKLTEDLLVDRGIIQDDDHRYLQGFTMLWGGYDKANPRIEIEVFQI